MSTPEPGLDITIEQVESSFEVRWTWRSGEFDRWDIQKFAEAFGKAIELVDEYCGDPKHFGYTPSDFPAAGIAQEEIDEILNGRSNVVDLYPLSPTQEGLLFRSLYDSESGAYFVQMTINLKGRVDTARLRDVWHALFERHAVFRTFFLSGRSGPFQAVARTASVEWEEHDWQVCDPTERHLRWRRLVESDEERGVKLTQSSLSRFACVRMAEDHVVLLWSHHHILFDGWSLALLLREAAEIYQGRPILPARPRPYREFIQSLKTLESQSEEFWRNELAGLSNATYLATGSVRADVRERYEHFQCSLPAITLEAASRAGVTMNAVCQAGWAILLASRLGTDDVVFGVTVSGRPAALNGVEHMVGLFINTLPLRVRIFPDGCIFELLRKLHDKTAEMNDCPQVPLSRIQRWSHLGAGRPLFDTLFVFENYPVTHADFAASSWTYSDLHTVDRTEFPLVAAVLPRENASLELTYKSSAFHDREIRSITEQYRQILSGISTAVLEAQT